jgi:hypothetical protein
MAGDEFRIDALTVVNFRGFGRLDDLKLDPQCTVLTGPNGSGKTALIDALAIAASHLLPDGSLRPVIEPSDVRCVATETAGLPGIEPTLPSAVKAWLTLFDGPVEVVHRLETMGAGPTMKRMGMDPWSMRTAIGNELPLVVRYPATRQARNFSWTLSPPEAREAGWVDWFGPAVNRQALVGWLRRMTYADVQSGAPSVHLAAVLQAIAGAVGGIREVRYDIRADELRATFEDGRTLPLERLSDGYRGIISMVADVAWRAVLLNPHHGAAAPARASGVVLIDEVDLHLHPSWQRRVLHDLTRVFPRLQFVVTTHSPQVVASARAEWVRVLDGQTARMVDHVEGRDSNSLLEDVFGVPARPVEFEERLRELFRAIDAGELATARTLAAALAPQLGPDDPDLTRARFLLDVVG